MTLPFDYGAVDPLEATIRYTSLDDLKDRLGIPTTDSSKDDQLTQSIVAAEYALDAELGRSFPDGPGTPGETEPGPVQGIPEAVKQAALSIAIAVQKEPDGPFGVAGSESFFGSIDISAPARAVVQRSVTLRGFKVAAGHGVA